MNPYLKKCLAPIFAALAKPGLGNPHNFCEEELMIAGVKPVAILREEEALSDPMKTCIQENKIILIGEATVNKITIQVFAQADKIEEGKELFDRLYKNDDQYPSINDPREFDKRIGQLLGYTENDIGWFIGGTYNDPITRFALKKTTKIRRWARKEYLIKYSP